MEELIRKLTSRKFWLALAGVVTGVALSFGVESAEIGTLAGAVTALASVITYVVTEGAVDMRSLESICAAEERETDDGDGKAAP